jgi:hypothetical protein
MVVERNTEGTVERRYRALGYAFIVRTNLPRARLFIDRLLAPFRVNSTIEGPTYLLIASHDDGGRFSLYLDDVCIQRVESPASMVDFVLADVTTRALEHADGFLAIHAAAASFRGQGFVLPAPPDSGKTTLVAGLTLAGFDYLSDEAALIDLGTGLLHPFPRPLMMDAGSVAALGDLGARLGAGEADFMRFRYHAVPGDLRPASLGRPCPIRYVIAPGYQVGGGTELSRVSRAEGMFLLARNAFNLDHIGGEALALLGRIVEVAGCYRLRIGDLGQAVREVVAVAESTPDRKDTGPGGFLPG